LIAVTAIPAVSIKVSVSVALPLRYEEAVSEGAVKPLDHRGSNQSAWKSKREKTRTKRRIEQYTQGRCSQYVPVRKRRT